MDGFVGLGVARPARQHDDRYLLAQAGQQRRLARGQLLGQEGDDQAEVGEQRRIGGHRAQRGVDQVGLVEPTGAEPFAGCEVHPDHLAGEAAMAAAQLPDGLGQPAPGAGPELGQRAVGIHQRLGCGRVAGHPAERPGLLGQDRADGGAEHRVGERTATGGQVRGGEQLGQTAVGQDPDGGDATPVDAPGQPAPQRHTHGVGGHHNGDRAQRIVTLVGAHELLDRLQRRRTVGTNPDLHCHPSDLTQGVRHDSSAPARTPLMRPAPAQGPSRRVLSGLRESRVTASRRGWRWNMLAYSARFSPAQK